METKDLIVIMFIFGMLAAAYTFLRWVLRGAPEQKTIKRLREVKKEIKSKNSSWCLEEGVFGGLYGKLITEQGEEYKFVLNYKNNMFVLNKILSPDELEPIINAPAGSIRYWIQKGCPHSG